MILMKRNRLIGMNERRSMTPMQRSQRIGIVYLLFLLYFYYLLRDETAPETIVDTSATQPSGWLDDEEEYIVDGDSKKPEDWYVLFMSVYCITMCCLQGR
jgi:hypothetical protein